MEKTNSLKSINVNNCGLGEDGVAFLARLLTAKCQKEPKLQLKLWEFHCAQNFMGEDAARDVAILFSQINSLESVDISANGIKYGLRLILKSLFNSKNSLQSLKIGKNKSVNKAVVPL